MNDIRISFLDCDNIQYLQSIKEFTSACDSGVVWGRLQEYVEPTKIKARDSFASLDVKMWTIQGASQVEAVVHPVEQERTDHNHDNPRENGYEDRDRHHFQIGRRSHEQSNRGQNDCCPSDEDGLSQLLMQFWSDSAAS